MLIFQFLLVYLEGIEYRIIYLGLCFPVLVACLVQRDNPVVIINHGITWIWLIECATKIEVISIVIIARLSYAISLPFLHEILAVERHDAVDSIRRTFHHHLFDTLHD